MSGKVAQVIVQEAYNSSGYSKWYESFKQVWTWSVATMYPVVRVHVHTICCFGNGQVVTASIAFNSTEALAMVMG